MTMNQAGSPIRCERDPHPPDHARRPPAATQPSDERRPVPVQVVRQPLAKLEVALARRPVTPRRRDLGDAPTRQRRLHRELEGELEAGGALDGDGVQEAPRIELEVVGRVVGRDAGEPVQGETGRAAHEPLERWPADLVAAAHVARRGHHVRTVRARARPWGRRPSARRSRRPWRSGRTGPWSPRSRPSSRSGRRARGRCAGRAGSGISPVRRAMTGTVVSPSKS